MILGASFGGVLIGVGIGLVVRCGASTGGSDFLAIILNSYVKTVSVAKWILIVDSVIIVLGGFVFGDYSLMLYAAISAYVTTKVADTIVDGGNTVKSVYIISEKSQQISNEIMSSINRGVTGIYGKGMYTNENKLILMCAASRGDVARVKQVVRKIDSKCFIIIANAREVVGLGFKT